MPFPNAPAPAACEFSTPPLEPFSFPLRPWSTYPPPLELFPLRPPLPSALGVGSTLRSGREFGTHGAIILGDFDVLDHLQSARIKNNDAENASDDHPVVLPPPIRHAGLRRSRSLSPPRRSSRLAPPRDESIDREGRTRAAHRANEQARLNTPLKRVVRKHVDNAQPIEITTAPQDYPVTSTGWGGIRDKPTTQQREYTVPELQHTFGMKIVEWDGSASRPLVDKEGRIIAVLGGRPNDPEYLRLTEQAARQLEAARGDLKFRPNESRQSE
ncbi:hypothetical protein C8R47DRAFT_1228809 [Mycena vitilis]|nr:hypothetical protein C8R47DRAFT_1228809 [Mycena vitilis]